MRRRKSVLVRLSDVVWRREVIPRHRLMRRPQCVAALTTGRVYFSPGLSLAFLASNPCRCSFLRSLLLLPSDRPLQSATSTSKSMTFDLTKLL